MHSRASGLLAPYLIEDTTTGTILGGANLRLFDPMRDTVELGYWLFVEARGRGVATRVVRALVEHAQANGIVRVEAHVRLGNARVGARARTRGFEREGIKRRLLRHGGERVDADAVRARHARRVKTLVIYLMAGRATPELAAAAVEGGADIVELGFPFSDPLADGPVIRRAGERALAEGMRTRECLECLSRARELVGRHPARYR